MKTGFGCTQDVAVYLKKQLERDNPGMEFYKFRKTTNFKGDYIVVNFLPFAYGHKSINDYNRVNVNIHIPELSSGDVPTKRLTQLVQQIETLIPYENAEEDTAGMQLNGAEYYIENVSQPMDDDDTTWFVNIVLKVIFNN